MNKDDKRVKLSVTLREVVQNLQALALGLQKY